MKTRPEADNNTRTDTVTRKKKKNARKIKKEPILFVTGRQVRHSGLSQKNGSIFFLEENEQSKPKAS